MTRDVYILNGLSEYVSNQHSRQLPNMFKCRKNGEFEKFFVYSYGDFAAKEILKQVSNTYIQYDGVIDSLNILVDQFNAKCSECKTDESKCLFISFYEVSSELLDIAYILNEDYKEVSK